VSSVFDEESGKYVLRVVGKGFTIPSAWWEQEANTGPGGYIQIPRPNILGSKATFSIAIRERAYTMFGGESFLNFYNPQTMIGLDLVGHYQMAFIDQEGIYSNDSKIAITERDFYQNSNYGSGGGIIFNNPTWASYQVVMDDGNISLFKNGSLLGQTTGTLPSSGNLWIGRHWWEGGDKYSTRLVADISDVHVYDRALSNTEVATLAASVLPEPSSLSLLLAGGVVFAAARRRKVD